MSNELLDYAVARLYEDVSSSPTPCKICHEETQCFDVVDLNKSCNALLYPRGLRGIPVFYRICVSCRFIFTNFFDRFSGDQWRSHIYNEDYANVDPDYNDSRPQRNAKEVEALLSGRRKTTVALDFGGGNGQTATLLRQRGWSYDTYDPFGHNDVMPDRRGRYNFCTAFEVFEHSPNPLQSLRNIVEMASPEELLVLIGTGIHDFAVSATNRLSWWYAAPRNGHISLYSRQSLRILAGHCGLSYTSVSTGTHLLYRGITEKEAYLMLLRGKVLKKLRSLILRQN